MPSPHLHALPTDAHKGQAGRLLSLAGSRLMPGAAILAARAAGRAGAGLVATLCTDTALLTLLPQAFPEGVLLDLCQGAWRAELAAGQHALLAGPGLGRGERAMRLVDGFLRAAPGVPRVLDADGLFGFYGRAEALGESAGPLVITPHAGEAAGLLGRAVPRDDAGRADFALELARLSGALVCLKGARTQVSNGQGSAANDTGNPGMATAGSGDVLTGLLGALLARDRAQGLDSALFELCRLGVRLHGRAGDLAAQRLGERSLLASDLVDALPEAFREMDLN